MRATIFALVLVAAGTAQAGNAQNLVISGSQLAPMGWAANGSAYAAAATDIDQRFQNRTQSLPDFSPESLSSQIEQSLESRLEDKLARLLQQNEQSVDTEVGAN